jgi:hypothetical protein
MVQLARSPDYFTCPRVLLEAADNERIDRAIFVFVSLSEKMRFPSWRTNSEIIFAGFSVKVARNPVNCASDLTGNERMGRASFLELRRAGCYLCVRAAASHVDPKVSLRYE